MASFPSVTFTRESTHVRFQAEDVPDSLNRRWYGMPRGVYIGFTPETTLGSLTLTLAVDVQYRFSLLRVGSRTERLQVALFTAEPVELEFTDHTQFPVYVIARADYVRKTPTKATILTRATGASGPQEVLLCKVDKPADDLVVESLSPFTKQGPTAFSGQTYGYMEEGAITDLASSDATVIEVTAARNSPYTGLHTSLAERINTDLSGAEMANRLGLRLNQIASNVHADRSGTAINVSGSFSQPDRDIGPQLTIEPGGSESAEGAITSALRNICFVVDASTGLRIVDTTTNLPIYGALTFVDAGGGISGTVGVGKTISFSNAAVTVNGGGTNPFVPGTLEEGDIVLGPPELPDYPSGRYYEILEILTNDEAVLKTAFQGADGSVTDTPFRRFTLTLNTTAGGFAGIPATDIQFVFPAFYRLDRAIFDGYLLIKKNGELPEVEEATQAETGKALLATAGGLVGSFRNIKNAGSAVASHIHTLNFAYGGATNAGGGVVNVAVTGAAGPAGVPANQGPTGPGGPGGPGFNLNIPFDESPISTDTQTVGGIVTHTHTVNFVSVHGFANPPGIVHLNGGWAGWPNGLCPLGFERHTIDSIAKISASEGRIIASIRPDGNTSASTIKIFLGASQ